MKTDSIIWKMITCGILCLCLGSVYSSSASRLFEVVDQSQEIYNPLAGVSIFLNQSLAQSFKPSRTPLVKVDFAISKGSNTTLPLIISIRADLDGDDLTSLSVPADQIATGLNTWHSFDVPDITVVPEQTYYIVLESDQPLNGYGLGEDSPCTIDEYPRGAAWGYWQQQPGNWSWILLEAPGYWLDYAFRTYTDIQPPNSPTINGPHYGKVNTDYTFEVGPITNPEGDDFFCMVDWGDGSYSDWLGPFHAGQTVSLTHAWSEPGNYSIKAKIKDPWGVESDWSAPFYIEIVVLKTRLVVGIVSPVGNISQADEFIILHSRFVVVFPSIPMFCIGRTLVLSKEEFHGILGKRCVLGISGTAVI